MSGSVHVSSHAPNAAATAATIISIFLVISAFLSNRFPFIRPLLAFFRLYRVGEFTAQLLLVGEIELVAAHEYAVGDAAHGVFYDHLVTNRTKHDPYRRIVARSSNLCRYERYALSRDKEGVLKLVQHGAEPAMPTETLREPFVFEFTGINPVKRYTEKTLEERLCSRLQDFMLELGKGFAFVGRQYKMLIGASQFKVDLVFYNWYLKCFVLIDLKRKGVTHKDIGQMNLYLNYFAAEIAEEITAIIAKHSCVDWTHNQTIHNRISQDIDDLFYAYEKSRGLVLSFDLIDKVIENVKTVALRRF